MGITLPFRKTGVEWLCFSLPPVGVECAASEMPHIESEIWQPLKDKGLVLVGIDRMENMQTALEFAQTMGITYPLAP